MRASEGAASQVCLSTTRSKGSSWREKKLRGQSIGTTVYDDWIAIGWPDNLAGKRLGFRLGGQE